jgi:hypothetical protein
MKGMDLVSTTPTYPYDHGTSHLSRYRGNGITARLSVDNPDGIRSSQLGRSLASSERFAPIKMVRCRRGYRGIALQHPIRNLGTLRFRDQLDQHGRGGKYHPCWRNDHPIPSRTGDAVGLRQYGAVDSAGLDGRPILGLLRRRSATASRFDFPISDERQDSSPRQSASFRFHARVVVG